MIQYGIRWPLASIDFESSALDKESYPIEVGVAIWPGPASPITIWSTLIEPAPEWVRDGVWFETAQRIHGISPFDLIGAMPVSRAMKTLNDVLAKTGSAMTDNLYWEDVWLGRLADAAGARPAFELEGMMERLAGLDLDVRIGMDRHHASKPRPHRAGPDATLLLAAIAAGMRKDPRIQEWRPD